MTIINEESVGTGQYYKNGNEKTRKIKTYAPIRENRQMRDWELQLNMYRIMAEHLDYGINSLKIFGVVRDGGTYMAKSRGIEKNFYNIEVDIIDDNDVTNYFEPKRNALMDSLASMKVPEICTPEENWNGNKCEKYCNVCEFCEK